MKPKYLRDYERPAINRLYRHVAVAAAFLILCALAWRGQ